MHHAPPNSLEELRLAHGRITNDANVDVTSQVDAFPSLLVHTTHELEQDALLDDLMAWKRVTTGNIRIATDIRWRQDVENSP
jgi:hypothetical protein